MDSTQHKLSKARPPRVQITYDLEVGNATCVKELPLVVGVMGEFSSDEKSLKNRKFINIDKDNFNDIMSSMKPSVNYFVESVLPGMEGKMNVSMEFNKISDFHPDSIVQKIEPLRKLLALREQLSDLRNRAASNEKLKDQLYLLTINSD
ncbi:type VI secretion system contractile sheath small subunit [Escherichia coli]|nr:type VI secretion system contractile sheath small subunit [Escherichia coli]EFP6925560.1 type VI secretion system contractile sheath small subunit [Shigella dysenteriae]EJF5752644.1 type VI secretion system contractile sheath small subunit [Shigella sonnei]EFO2173065.1 type VI secretion system contractile sheath small subunit [Escherichia coli]EFO4690236.1 type VI secretion system contractile sheath small subunit [Escherichia coli]